MAQAAARSAARPRSGRNLAAGLLVSLPNRHAADMDIRISVVGTSGKGSAWKVSREKVARGKCLGEKYLGEKYLGKSGLYKSAVLPPKYIENCIWLGQIHDNHRKKPNDACCLEWITRYDWGGKVDDDGAVSSI